MQFHFANVVRLEEEQIDVANLAGRSVYAAGIQSDRLDGIIRRRIDLVVEHFVFDPLNALVDFLANIAYDILVGEEYSRLLGWKRIAVKKKKKKRIKINVNCMTG